ncbi:hypothetical protein T484DRAFT_1838194 [Baffinella frigidus]|nr:hypothetical protein T484DRAFT_1838194 [Cryptophyta sp. CCMP2293]
MSLTLWNVPTLPLRAGREGAESGGWLDFVYLDDELRITKGNRGGTFVHVRPSRVAELFPVAL